MESPSLGQAIGLNVKNKDIFTPAAKMLSENLSALAEKKEKKAKAREDQYNKFLDEIIGLRKNSMHVREQANYDAAVNDLKRELDSKFESGADQRSLAESFFNFYDKQSLIKKRSDMLLEDQKSAFQNPSVVNSRVAAKIYRTGEELTPEDVIEAQAMGIDYNPDTREIMSRRIQYTSIPETIKNIKFNKAEADKAMAFMTEEQKKVASMSPADQAIYRGTKIPGFTQKVTEVTRPSQALYEMKVDTFLNTDKGYTESALQEIESNLPQGQTLSSVIKKKQEELKTANNGVEPTLDLVKKSLAKDHFMSMYDTWASENAVSDEFQREPKGGDGKNGDQPTRSISATIEESHLSSEGKKRARELKMDEQVAIDISLGRIDASPEDKKKANRITQGAILGAGPTVSFQVLGGEQVTIGRDAVNPRKLWYDKKTKKFHLSYDKQVSGEQTSENLSGKDIVLTREQLKQLQNSKNSSVMDQLEQWDLNAKKNGVPTIDAYITSGGAAPSSSGSSYNWSGASTK